MYCFKNKHTHLKLLLFLFLKKKVYHVSNHFFSSVHLICQCHVTNCVSGNRNNGSTDESLRGKINNPLVNKPTCGANCFVAKSILYKFLYVMCVHFQYIYTSLCYVVVFKSKVTMDSANVGYSYHLPSGGWNYKIRNTLSQFSDLFSEFNKYIAPAYHHDRCER